MKKNWASLIFFSILLAAIFPASSFAQTGSLYITSKPPGANIILDDNPIPKKTNSLLQGIPVGNHKITLEYQGLGRIDKIVAVREGLTSEINFEFQPEKPKEIAAPPKKAPVPTPKPKEIPAPIKKAPIEEKIQPPAAKPEPPKSPQPEPAPGMESLTRGLAHLEKKQFDLAVAEFSKAIELGQRGKSSYQHRGLAYLEKAQYNFALSDFSKAIEIDPKDPWAFEMRALTFLATDQYKPAIVDLQKGIDLDPKNAAPCYFILGFASSKLGETKEAREFFLKAKDLSSDVIEKWVERLGKATDPNLKRVLVETLLLASEHLDISSRVLARAKEMGKEIPTRTDQESWSFLKALDSWAIVYILLLLSGGILAVLGILYLIRKRGKPLEEKRSSTPKTALGAATPIECLKVARPEKSGGLRETTIVGNYQIVDKIASGGMANIYKAVHISQGGFAVLKIPYEQFLNDPKFVDRFRREAELGRKLYNENIINIYESATTVEGITYIAMEYLEGIDLRRYLNKYGKVSIPDALKILTRVCRALDYAHIKGVIHRDIKPENIMLPHDLEKGRVVLMDFGVAHATYMCTVATRTTFIGTPYYMSPDQLSGDEVDARSDIYSLGVVFFEMLTGQRPFNEKDALKVLIQHQKALPPRPSSLNRSISPDLDLIILRMLAKDPADRYQSGEALLVSLKDYMLREGIEVM